MKKTTADWEIWVYILCYFALLGGLVYLNQLITPLPYILIILTTSIVYLIYKDIWTIVKREDAASVIAMLFFVIVIADIAFFVKPDRYKNYLGQFFVSGKMTYKTVIVEADDAPNTWEERREIWQPDTKAGESVMDIIEYFNWGFMITSFVVCIKFYSKSTDHEKHLQSSQNRRLH